VAKLIDRQVGSSGYCDLKLGHRQAAIEEDEGSVVFEFAVGGPLHADELRGEHGEAGVAQGDDGFGVGDRVGGLVGGVGRVGRKRGNDGWRLGGACQRRGLCRTTDTPSDCEPEYGKMMQR
jgi:hypothetical protein